MADLCECVTFRDAEALCARRKGGGGLCELSIAVVWRELRWCLGHEAAVTASRLEHALVFEFSVCAGGSNRAHNAAGGATKSAICYHSWGGAGLSQNARFLGSHVASPTPALGVRE